MKDIGGAERRAPARGKTGNRGLVRGRAWAHRFVPWKGPGGEPRAIHEAIEESMRDIDLFADKYNIETPTRTESPKPKRENQDGSIFSKVETSV